jgi:hypothetical protein
MIRSILQTNRLRHAAYPRVFAGMLATVALSSCQTTLPTRIDAEDTNVFQPSLRASFNVNGGERPASEARSGHAIEIGYQSTKVSSNQSLSPGQLPVVHNGTTFSSPNQLRNDFDFSYADVSWRMREFGGGRFGMEFSAGLGQASLGLAVSSAMQSAARNYSNTGLQLGLGFMWRTSPASLLNARASYYLAMDTGVSNITKYELYYAHAIHKNLSFRAGYADWNVNGFGDSGESDFHMHFAGPILILDCSFNLGD